MIITVIGAGNIGGTLGKQLANQHTVRFGVRNPDDEKYADLREFGSVQTISEALAETEVVLLALPGKMVEDFMQSHASQLVGTYIIDATNNVGALVMNNLDVIKHHAPEAHLARAFSTLGWENFAHPHIHDTQIDLFYAAESAAQAVIGDIIAAVGLHPVYIGDLATAPILDHLTQLWFKLAFEQGLGRRIALKLLQE